MEQAMPTYPADKLDGNFDKFRPCKLHGRLYMNTHILWEAGPAGGLRGGGGG